MLNRHVHAIKTQRSVNFIFSSCDGVDPVMEVMEQAADSFNEHLDECSCGDCETLEEVDIDWIFFMYAGSDN